MRCRWNLVLGYGEVFGFDPLYLFLASWNVGSIKGDRSSVPIAVLTVLLASSTSSNASLFVGRALELYAALDAKPWPSRIVVDPHEERVASAHIEFRDAIENDFIALSYINGMQSSQGECGSGWMGDC